ncbi:MAG: transporter involved in cytochrome c biosis, CcmB subunit [Micavibrio sp.]|nr:transporter involved in cytochrome c biosis, CcmB subunit [Micavibrio sp.]
MILSAHAITCQRGQTIVLRDVSFTLQNGEVMAVTGSNGSGKSTILRACAGLNDPVAGAIETIAARRWIGTHAPLKPTLTVSQNLAFWLALQGGTEQDTITRALHKFEIAHLAGRLVSTLSSGQKQRVSLARLFLSDEKLWLLDEPESALDTDGRDLMRRALSEHCGDGGAALIATHNADLWSPATTFPLNRHPGESRDPSNAERITNQAVIQHPIGPGFRRDDDNIISTFTATLSRDLNLFRSSKADCLQPVTLFVLMIVLFPLSLGPDATTLAPIAGGLIMMAAFFASLLPLENIFTDDAGDATIETIMTTSAPLPVYAAARMLAHWLSNGLSVTILTPLGLVMLGAPAQHMAQSTATTLAATLLFTLIGSSISALVLSTRKGAILLALLAVPLYIPVLIFGSGALSQIINDHSPLTPLLLLWAMVAAFLPLAPLMASGCLRLMRD